MRPILYPANETAFDSNGLGILSDAISCSVVESLNSKFELSLKYPVSGLHCGSITYRSIILAKPNLVSQPQPFRVYRMVPTSAGTVTVYARHIAYDLLGLPVSPFKSYGGAKNALYQMTRHTAFECPFTFTSDRVSSVDEFQLDTPRAAWRCLGGQEGSVLDVFGGEYEFDRWNITLHNRRGADRGVSIRYGKNLSTLEQDKNCAECYTGVYPFWQDAEGNLVELYPPIVEAPGTYSYTNILTLDCSQYFEERPTTEELKERAEKYISDHDIGVPKVSWKIQFIPLEQTDEYRNYAQIERVLVGDEVAVCFPEMNVDATARVVTVDYDPIGERYNSVTLGSVQSNLAQTLAQQAADIQRKPSLSLVQAITMTLTGRILGAKGGAVRLLDTDGDDLPDTLYVADDPDPDKAVKVWRWNYEGWAGSLNGYNGPFTVGATLEDGLLATAVTAANLVAGTIQSADGGKTFFLDLDNGVLDMNATSLTIAGKSVSALIDEKMTQEDIFNALTNNGADQGIYLQDGKIYINLEYLGAGAISAENVTLDGLFEVWGTSTLGNRYLGGYIGYMTGSVDGGIITNGVAMYNADKSCYCIVTTEGIRLQGGSSSLYITKNGKITVGGDLEVAGSVTYAGTLSKSS